MLRFRKGRLMRNVKALGTRVLQFTKDRYDIMKYDWGESDEPFNLLGAFREVTRSEVMDGDNKYDAQGHGLTRAIVSINWDSNYRSVCLFIMSFTHPFFARYSSKNHHWKINDGYQSTLKNIPTRSNVVKKRWLNTNSKKVIKYDFLGNGLQLIFYLFQTYLIVKFFKSLEPMWLGVYVLLWNRCPMRNTARILPIIRTSRL